MKTPIASLLIFISLFSYGQSKVVATHLKVFGNCVMCKNRIETALDQPGIKKAVWDVKSKNLEVVYNSSKISLQRINELLASVGHDTETTKAKDEVYATLPFCCLYRDHGQEMKASNPKQ